jgi:hypothetical protein
MRLAERRSVATSLRAASRDIADAGLLVDVGPRNALLLLRRAVGRVVCAMLISELGMSADDSAGPNLDQLDEANPLKRELADLWRRSDAAHRYERPGRNGLLPAPPTSPEATDLLRRVRILVDDAMDGFGVFLNEEAPAQRTTPLRSEPEPEPEPEPVRVAPKPKARQVSPPKPPPVSNVSPRPIVVGPPSASHEAAPRSQPHTVPGAHPIEPAGRIGSVTSVAFWSLMESWKIGDVEALHLLGHNDGLTKKGTRPRFKLVGPEADLFVVLREIDTTLRAASLEPTRWLRTPTRSNPLAGKTPIAHITSAGVAGARDVLRLAAQEGFRGSMVPSVETG